MIHPVLTLGPPRLRRFISMVDPLLEVCEVTWLADRGVPLVIYGVELVCGCLVGILEACAAWV